MATPVNQPTANRVSPVGAIAGHVTVGVMGEALGRAGDRDLIGTGPRVAAVVRRLDVHGVRAAGQCRIPEVVLRSRWRK